MEVIKSSRGDEYTANPQFANTEALADYNEGLASTTRGTSLQAGVERKSYD